MTVHAAKGLEFPYVFIVSLNEDVFPSKKVDTLPAMEEERRLFFVALTRAEKGLFLTEAEGRTLDGSPRYPSRFILDIGDEMLEMINPPKEELVKSAREYANVKESMLPENLEKSILKKSSRVRHDVFGLGTIMDFDEKAKVYIIKFDILDTPRRLNMRIKLTLCE